jgi:hypothetical protein
MTGSDTTIEANRPPQGEREDPRAPVASTPPPPTGEFDSGEPVDVPPPIIEPVGFDDLPPPSAAAPQAQRQPLRGLLAALAETTAAGRAPPLAQAPVEQLADRPPVPAPEPVGPHAQTKSAAATRLAAAPAGGWRVPMRLQGLTQKWRDAVTIPSTPNGRRVVYWGRWVASAIVVLGVVYVAVPSARTVLFHRSSGAFPAAPSDPAERLAFFQRGAQAGSAEAELQLAILYAKGEGVAQDYETGAKWFRAAADQGLPRAQYDMGVLYERGRGVPADPEQAASWYQKAADGKYPLAQYNLAVAYTKGQGVRKDLSEATLWYRRAAGQGVVLAMLNLGMLYERGEGVAVSLVDAYAWYKAAGQRGNQAAARRAEDLFNGMSRLDQTRAEALASDVASSIHDVAPDSGGTPTG